jgi:hypothetical protein
MKAECFASSATASVVIRGAHWAGNALKNTFWVKNVLILHDFNCTISGEQVVHICSNAIISQDSIRIVGSIAGETENR